MLSPKANAALMRLKEIEEKYKIKRIEQKWKHNEDTDSSISSVSMNPSENVSMQSKESPRNVSKPKLDIKMPDTKYLEEHSESAHLLSQNKRSDKTSPKLLKAVDLLLENKSLRSMGKQESSGLDTTIQENSSIESALDYSMTPSKSLSHSKTSRQSSMINNKSSRQEKIKAGTRFERGKQSDGRSQETSRRKSSDNTLITKRSKMHEKSNKKVSKPHSNLETKEYSSVGKEIAKISKETRLGRNSRISNHSGLSHSDNIIGDSISTLEDGSEIISELSHIEESVADKTENGSLNNSEYLITENASANISKNSKYSTAENGYANDTFEDISSSTMRSKSESQNEKIINRKRVIASRAKSSIKKIETASLEGHKFYEGGAESRRDGQIKMFTSKAIFNTGDSEKVRLNKETSNYVKNLERIDANSDNANMRLLKSPKSSSSHSKRQERPYKRRTDSFEENVSSGDNSINLTIPSTNANNKNMSGSLTMSDSAEETSIGDVTKTDERTSWRESSAEIRTIPVTVGRQESGQEERGKASNEMKERALMDAVRSLVIDDGERIDPTKMNSPNEKEKNILKKNLNQRISQDVKNVTNVLRRLHKDMLSAVAIPDNNLNNMEKVSENSFESEIEPQHSTAAITTKRIKAKKEEKSDRTLEKNRMFDRNGRDDNVKRQKRRAITNLKSSEARNRTGNRKEDKALKYDRKQFHKLQKRTVEMRLRREREDLQKYLHLRELKDLKLGLGPGSTQSYFSPLEFPKIAEFKQSDVIDSTTKLDQRVVLQERVLAIRRWLKDQYILYRDYCTMAQAINAHYVPTTVEDAKKTIHELGKKTTGKVR